MATVFIPSLMQNMSDGQTKVEMALFTYVSTVIESDRWPTIR